MLGIGIACSIGSQLDVTISDGIEGIFWSIYHQTKIAVHGFINQGEFGGFAFQCMNDVFDGCIALGNAILYSVPEKCQGRVRIGAELRFLRLQRNPLSKGMQAVR